MKRKIAFLMFSIFLTLGATTIGATEEDVLESEDTSVQIEENNTFENERVEEGTLEEELGNTEKEKKLENITPLSAASSISVTTEAELVSELADVSSIMDDTKVITIENDIVLTNVINVNMSHNKNVVIKGATNDVTLFAAVNKKHFTIIDGTGNLTISNLVLKGLITGSEVDWATITSMSKGGGINGNIPSGSLTLENLEYSFIRDGGLSVKSGKTTINNVSFLHNFSSEGGAAIRYDGVAAPSYVTNSTFDDNSTRTEGYTGGAIHLKSGNTDFFIDSSKFTNNYMSGGGNIMAGGGAIAIAQSMRTFRVSNSYFEDNSVKAPISGGFLLKGENSDGGAIYIFTSQGEHTIDNTTFVNNEAYDEGGAISFVLTSNVNNAVRNSTFVGNIAQSSPTFDGDDGGGAIEVSGNTSTRPYVTIESNTFFGNKALDSNRGGAISWKDADGAMKNNILSGNTSEGGSDGGIVGGVNYNNVYFTSTASGIVQDTNLVDQNVEEIFGTTTPTLSANGSTIYAGNQNDGSKIIIPTLFISPNNGSTANGLADNTGVTALTADERGFTRSTTPDIGAVDMLSVTFDANSLNGDALEAKAYWTGTADTVEFTPLTSYAKYDSTGTTKEVISTTNYGGTATLPVLNPTSPDGHTFLGWNTDVTAATALTSTQLDAVLTNITTEGIVLYAIWEAPVAYRVLYNGNTNTAGVTPMDTTVYNLRDSATVLGQNTLVKNGYIFKGWNTSADGSGTPYQEGDSLIIATQTITLYAVWEAEPIVVKPSKPTVVKPSSPTTGDTTNTLLWVTLLGISTLVLIRKYNLRKADMNQ